MHPDFELPKFSDTNALQDALQKWIPTFNDFIESNQIIIAEVLANAK